MATQTETAVVKHNDDELYVQEAAVSLLEVAGYDEVFGGTNSSILDSVGTFGEIAELIEVKVRLDRAAVTHAEQKLVDVLTQHREKRWSDAAVRAAGQVWTGATVPVFRLVARDECAGGVDAAESLIASRAASDGVRIVVQLLRAGHLQTVAEGGPAAGSEREDRDVRPARVARARSKRSAPPPLESIEEKLSGEAAAIYRKLVKRAGPFGLVPVATKSAGITLSRKGTAYVNVPVPQDGSEAFVIGIKTEHLHLVEDLALRHLRAGHFRWQLYACQVASASILTLERVAANAG